MWGQPGPIDASHLGKPFALTRAGETGMVFAESRHLNRSGRSRESCDRAIPSAGLFTREHDRDPNARKGVRHGPSPEAPAFREPPFRDWRPPTRPPAPQALTAATSQTSISSNPSAVQLELPLNTSRPTAADTHAGGGGQALNPVHTGTPRVSRVRNVVSTAARLAGSALSTALIRRICTCSRRSSSLRLPNWTRN